MTRHFLGRLMGTFMVSAVILLTAGGAALSQEKEGKIPSRMEAGKGTSPQAAYQQALRGMQRLAPEGGGARGATLTPEEVLNLPSVRQNLEADSRTRPLLQNPELMGRLLANPVLQKVLRHPATRSVLENPKSLDQLLSGKVIGPLLDNPQALQGLLERPEELIELMAHPAVPGELVVKFNGRGTSSAQAAHARMNATLIKVIEPLNLHHVKLPPGLGIQEAIQRYQALPGVVYAEPNYVYHTLDTTPNDPFFPDLWGMPIINAPRAWDETTGDSVIVADIDTGVDYTHEDLANNMWTNPGEIPGNGVDDDGNGYIDDVFGIDTYDDDSDPMDEHGHGTHTSGTIGAEGNNGIGVVGVVWKAYIMALRWIGPDGCGDMADAVDCFMYLRDLQDAGVDVCATSNSWGGNHSRALEESMQQVADRGALHIVAAGNDGWDNDANDTFPANYDMNRLVSVAASDPADNPAVFSNWGRQTVDLAAPGVDILSTVPGSYSFMSGTSMATPHVAGAAALLRSLHPGWGPGKIKEHLLNSAAWLPVQWGGMTVTEGRLNVWNAANSLPVVTGVWPPHGATSVSPYEPLGVHFSKPMKHGSVENNLNIASTTGGWDPLISSHQWNDSTQLTVKTRPKKPFQPLHTYEITVGGNAKSQAKKKLDGNRNGTAEGSPTDDFVWVFTTGVPPRPWCDLVSPRDGEQIGLPYTLQAKAIPDPLTDINNVRFYTADGTRTPIFEDDMESGAGSWTTGGDGNEWEWGPPTAGPSGAHSGSNCWGTDLDDTYEDNADCWLRSPEIFLPPDSTLSFWHWYSTETDYDFGYVEISQDGGATWQPLASYTGFGDWTQETFDLADYFGPTYFRWRLQTDGSSTDYGWYIDDVVIEAPDWAPTDGPVTLISPNGCYEQEIPDSSLSAGTYDFLAIATDNYGSRGFDISRDVGIHPDNPEVILVEPSEGASIGGTFLCQAEATARAAGASMDRVTFQYPGFADPSTDTVGGTDVSWIMGETDAGVGNVVECTSPTLLQRYSAYLNPGEDTELRFIVYESEDLNGPFTNIGESIVPNSGTGAGWRQSGDLNIPLQEGRFYYLSCYWSLYDLVFYDQVVLPQPVSFGSVVRGGFDWDHAYPPPPEITSPSVLSESECLYFQYEVLNPGWVEIGTDTTNAYTILFDTTVLPDGPTLIRAEGEDSLGNIGTDTHGVTIDNTPPKVKNLRANPNPFTNTTKIKFTLNERSKVVLKIVDKNGKLVKKLIEGNNFKDPGRKVKVWDGTDQDGKEVADGNYWARARAEDAAGNLSTWKSVKITKTSSGGVSWTSPPPSQMQSGQEVQVSWEIIGTGEVESTYLLYGASGNLQAAAEGKIEGQPDSSGTYQVTWQAARPGKYSFVAVARIGGKLYYSPVVVSTVGL